jgi:hypothetical protein
MKRIAALSLTLTIGIMALSSTAMADFVFTIGNNPQPNEQNILFQNPQTGTCINGATQTGVAVQFCSTTDTLVQNAQGQADVFAQDGTLNNISLGLQTGFTALDFILNPQDATGTINVCVNGATSGVNCFQYSGGTGQNFLTIVAINGQFITSIAVNGSFTDLKQPRISGVAQATNPVPEPASMALFGSGLCILGGLVRRRLQKKV